MEDRSAAAKMTTELNIQLKDPLLRFAIPIVQ